MAFLTMGNADVGRPEIPPISYCLSAVIVSGLSLVIHYSMHHPPPSGSFKSPGKVIFPRQSFHFHFLRNLHAADPKSLSRGSAGDSNFHFTKDGLSERWRFHCNS
jgi:hypothetical protein